MDQGFPWLQQRYGWRSSAAEDGAGSVGWGLVLGVGAVVTLAAWQDDEFAHGTFTSSGDFALAGQVSTAEGFTDHASSPGGALAFDVNAASLAPGMVSYSPYGVELAAGTTVPATVTVTAGTPSGTVDDLTYGIYAVDSFTCDAAAVTAGTAVIPEGTAIDTVPADTTFDLAAATSDTAGAPQYLCLVVTAGGSGHGADGCRGVAVPGGVAVADRDAWNTSPRPAVVCSPAWCPGIRARGRRFGVGDGSAVDGSGVRNGNIHGGEFRDAVVDRWGGVR
ncbi:SipW-dependent-type signal peptide-containing protein [Curtobacterium flaccumfaciens]|nr:SipW-dependent-type signal peptide-containing protein [Curtobacterium flaccumfaciens]